MSYDEMTEMVEQYQVRRCVLCKRELPALKWYERGTWGMVLLGKPPLCWAYKELDSEECKRIFIEQRRVSRGNHMLGGPEAREELARCLEGPECDAYVHRADCVYYPKEED